MLAGVGWQPSFRGTLLDVPLDGEPEATNKWLSSQLASALKLDRD